MVPGSPVLSGGGSGSHWLVSRLHVWVSMLQPGWHWPPQLSSPHCLPSHLGTQSQLRGCMPGAKPSSQVQAGLPPASLQVPLPEQDSRKQPEVAKVK